METAVIIIIIIITINIIVITTIAGSNGKLPHLFDPF